MLKRNPFEQQLINFQQISNQNPYLVPSYDSSFYDGPGLPASNSGAITPPTKTDANLVFDSIRQIVETHQGERLLLPTFGSRIFELIGEPLSQVFEHKVNLFLTDAIKQWETRIRLTSVKFLYNQNSVTVTYTVQLIKLGQSAQSSFQLPRGL